MLIINSSMPRSGSTLLQNILAQNPSITSSPTSILGELVDGIKRQIRQSPSVKAEGYDHVVPKFQAFIKGSISGWHQEALKGADASIYIDKSRSWLFNKDLLDDIYGDDYKILCIVRDLRDVVASMEKNHRKNIYRSDHIEQMGGINLTQRINCYLSSAPISPFVDKLVDLIQIGNTKNIIFVKFEDLLENPQEVMNDIYKLLGLPSYQHDFNNIPQSTFEDDEFHGIYGQHKIKSKLQNPNSVPYFNTEIGQMINKLHPMYQSTFGYIKK